MVEENLVGEKKVEWNEKVEINKAGFLLKVQKREHLTALYSRQKTSQFSASAVRHQWNEKVEINKAGYLLTKSKRDNIWAALYSQ